MPSVSLVQKRTMQAAAHNPKFAARVKIPMQVAKDFVRADKRAGKRKLPKRANRNGKG